MSLLICASRELGTQRAHRRHGMDREAPAERCDMDRVEVEDENHPARIAAGQPTSRSSISHAPQPSTGDRRPCCTASRHTGCRATHLRSPNEMGRAVCDIPGIQAYKSRASSGASNGSRFCCAASPDTSAKRVATPSSASMAIACLDGRTQCPRPLAVDDLHSSPECDPPCDLPGGGLGVRVVPSRSVVTRFVDDNVEVRCRPLPRTH